MLVRSLAVAMSWFTAAVISGFLLVPLLAHTEGSQSEAQVAEEPAEETGQDEGRQPTVVTFIEAVSQPIEDVERTLATVEAKWSARIAAEVAAVIETIEVDAGDRVEPGMLLATLDSRDFEIEVSRAAANVRRIETTIANSERDVTRQRQLAERGHVSEAALEGVESELEALRQELEAARSESRRAERNLERSEVRAPHAGIVAERLVSEGDYVSAGTVILEIPRADRLQVRIPMPEAAAERLELGMPVRLTTVTANNNVTAEITQIQPRVTASSRTVTVVAEIDNPGGWRPGSSVNAEVVMETRQAIALEPTSVVRRAAGNVIYVIEDGVAKERSVSLGQRTRDWVEVIDGVEPGDRVIVDGAGFMTDDAPVDPRADERQPLEPAIADRGGSPS